MMKKKLKQHRTILIMAPVLLIAGIFVLNMAGVQFLVIDFGEGISTMNQTFSPTGDIVASGDTATVGVGISYILAMSDGQYTGTVTGLTMVLTGPSGSITILDINHAGKTSDRQIITKTLIKGSYSLKVTMRTSGEIIGAIGGTISFDVTGTKPELTPIDPIDGGTIVISESVVKGDIIVIPVKISVTSKGSLITEVSAHFSSNSEYIWKGSGEGIITAEPRMLVVSSEGTNIINQRELYIWVTAADGAKVGITMKITIKFAEITSPTGDSLVPSFEFMSAIMGIFIIGIVLKWRKHDE